MKVITILVLIIFSFKLIAQTPATIIPLRTKADESNIKLYTSSHEEKKKKEKTRIYYASVTCNGNEVFKGNVASEAWEVNLTLKNGGTKIVIVPTLDGKFLHFAENGKLPLPENMVLLDMSDKLETDRNNIIWMENRDYARPATDKYKLFDLNCQLIFDYFKEYAKAAYNKDMFIVRREGKSAVFSSLKNTPIISFDNTVYFMGFGNSTDLFQAKRDYLQVADSCVIIINQEGKKLNQFPIRKIYESKILTESKWIVYQSGELLGLLNLVTAQMIKPQFNSIWGNESNSFISVKLPTKNNYAIMNSSGKIFTDYVYDIKADQNRNSIVCKKNGKAGLIDTLGKTLIPFNYFSIEAERIWDVFFKKFNYTQCYFVKKDSLGKFAFFSNDGIQKTDFIYDSFVYEEQSNTIIANSNGNKEVFNIGGDLKNKEKVSKETSKYLIKDFNEKYKLYDNRMKFFTEKWNAIVNDKNKTQSYKVQLLNKLILDNVDYLKNLIAELIEDLRVNEEYYKSQLTETNAKKLKENLKKMRLERDQLINITPNPLKTYSYESKE